MSTAGQGRRVQAALHKEWTLFLLHVIELPGAGPFDLKNRWHVEGERLRVGAHRFSTYTRPIEALQSSMIPCDRARCKDNTGRGAVAPSCALTRLLTVAAPSTASAP
jgi:hypothetical protein